MLRTHPFATTTGVFSRASAVVLADPLQVSSHKIETADSESTSIFVGRCWMKPSTTRVEFLVAAFSKVWQLPGCLPLPRPCHDRQFLHMCPQSPQFQHCPRTWLGLLLESDCWRGLNCLPLICTSSSERRCISFVNSSILASESLWRLTVFAAGCPVSASTCCTARASPKVWSALCNLFRAVSTDCN